MEVKAPTMTDGDGRRDRERNEQSGRYTSEFTDGDFLDAVEQGDENGELGTGTTTVAERVGCDRRTAHVRLTALEEDGRVRSRKFGRSLAWFPVDAPEGDA